MLGVLPKSQGIANKKDDLAKREVIFLLVIVFSLSFVSVFSLFLFFSLCFFPIQQSFSFIIQLNSQSYHFSLVSLERLYI